MYGALKKFTPVLATLHKARVLKDFVTYSFGSLLLRAVSLFLLPFILRILTPADYGALALITAFITISTAVMGLGLRQLLSIEYFHHNLDGQKTLVNEIILIYTLFALPIITIAWQLRSYINHYIFFNALSSSALLACVTSIFFFFYAELFYQILQYQRRSMQLTLVQIMIASMTTLSTFITVWVFKMGVAGVVWAQACGHICATAIAFFSYYTNQYFQFFSSKKIVAKITPYLNIGLPFIPGIICSWLLASSDRWMLGYYYSMKQVGIYSIADLFAQVFNALVLVPWAGSYLPYILQRYKKHAHELNKIEQENQRTMWISMATALVCITLGLSIGKPLLHWILPPTYHASLNYVWILLMGQVFLLGSYFASAIIQYRKRTLFLALALLAPATVNIILNYILIIPLGILGCSIATLISYFVYFAITALYTKTL